MINVIFCIKSDTFIQPLCKYQIWDWGQKVTWSGHPSSPLDGWKLFPGCNGSIAALYHIAHTCWLTFCQQPYGVKCRGLEFQGSQLLRRRTELQGKSSTEDTRVFGRFCLFMFCCLLNENFTSPNCDTFDLWSMVSVWETVKQNEHLCKMCLRKHFLCRSSGVRPGWLNSPINPFFSAIWQTSPLGGRILPEGGARPLETVPKATGAGQTFRHCCLWRRGVTWTLPPPLCLRCVH